MNSAQRTFLGAYLLLLFVCGGLLLLSEVFGPAVRQAVIPVASDGFKTTLGAVLGALSVMLGAPQMQKGPLQNEKGETRETS